MLTAIYPQKWSGTDTLISDALLVGMTTTGKDELPLTSHWFEEVTRTPCLPVSRALEDTSFIRVKNGGKNRAIEILNPETSRSMPAKIRIRNLRSVSFIDQKTAQRR